MCDEPEAAFHELKEVTLCPFARTARLEYAPTVEKPFSVRSVAINVVKGLTDHFKIAREKRLGGYVVRLPSLGNTFQSDVRDFAAFIRAISEVDASCSRSMSADIGAEGWNLEIGDQPVFVNFFSEKYPTAHSKYIASPGFFWIYFQPEYVFDMFNINRDARSTKAAIRKSFSDAGMDYDFTQIDLRRKALCFVFPESIELDPVEWWRL